MPESVTLEGLPELKAALTRKASEVMASARAAVAAEARLVVDDARREAPYLDASDPDGHIRDDIKAEVEGAEASVHVKNRHAAFQEFGTSRNAPQPFMHPAAQKSRARFPRAAAELIKNAIGG